MPGSFRAATTGRFRMQSLSLHGVERPVIDQIQRDVTELIGYSVNGSVHAGESGFVKKGTESAGVKRQYCGRLGKVENCQVGVFLGYTDESYRTLVDAAIYLPKSRAEDRERREKAVFRKMPCSRR